MDVRLLVYDTVDSVLSLLKFECGSAMGVLD